MTLGMLVSDYLIHREVQTQRSTLFLNALGVLAGLKMVHAHPAADYFAGFRELDALREAFVGEGLTHVFRTRK